jgi:DNA replication ATP-dependent helicase/nuclease Dna2
LVWFQVPGRTSTQYNRREAEIAVGIVAGCLNAGLNARDIAVVTPFRRQAVLIRNLLSERLRRQDPLPVVDTVERVQGLTVEVIIVSMCATEPSYVASIAGFLFSPNRTNVAVSRARTKAIVLSSPDVFSVVPGEYSAILGRDKCLSLLKGVSRRIAANP